MSLKAFLQKKCKLIRLGYSAFCVLAGVVTIAIGYPFFIDRPRLLTVFSIYILLMAGVVIFVGLHILDRLLEDDPRL